MPAHGNGKLLLKAIWYDCKESKDMRIKSLLPPLLLMVIMAALGVFIYLKVKGNSAFRQEMAIYSGSESCRPCHERFYQLWQDSYHGLAMQPVTAQFIRTNIHTLEQEVSVDEGSFRVILEADTLFFIERLADGTETRFPAIHTMGGKYIYYFLTPLSGGRLQVLPLAYDCSSDSWYNNPESGVRHFETLEDVPLEWRSHLFTFNTTCYNCHVSQLETNYSLAENRYNTTWREPGINCETCHGPSYEHIVECVKAGEGNVPRDLKIVVTSSFTPDQHNSACGSCHAKAAVIAQAFEPGGSFYDYFDLITLESPDYYADGRDLGENYTMTTWEMNRCAAASEMHCVDCHTSSGRYRFAAGNPNDACMPCHSERVSNVSAHSFHEPGSAGSQCVSCHMPQTTFARMTRSDHSFRPPMPKATIAFGSPNACNICHSDRSPEWADRIVGETHNREYQNEAVANGMLIRKAREGDWSALGTILTGLDEGRFDNVYTTSFIRLLEACSDQAKWPVMRRLTNHQSPLVRGAAAHSLFADSSQEAQKLLTGLVNDRYRVVRLNAAYALSNRTPESVAESDKGRIAEALREYEESLVTHSDSWPAHYNLGLYYSNQQLFDKALESYNTSLRIFPEAVMPMVNAGVIYYTLRGDYRRAEEMFTRALTIEPGHEAALTNLALLSGERGESSAAETYFRQLMEVSERNAMAAYNLAVLAAQNDLKEAVRMSRKAMEWEPGNPKYAYTCAYYMASAGERVRATEILTRLTAQYPGYFEPYLLLTDIMMTTGQREKAGEIVARAQKIEGLTYEQQRALAATLERLGRDDN